MTPLGNVVGECLALVAPAEAAFRSRWRLGTLRRVDPALADAVVEQLDLYDAAMVTGTDAEARLQAAAMVRGWRAACAALEGPLLPDDAYFVGFDDYTGSRVVIAETRASVARVQALKGEKVILVTPDEVARLVGGLAVMREAKAVFPDAELVSVSVAA